SVAAIMTSAKVKPATAGRRSVGCVKVVIETASAVTGDQARGVGAAVGSAPLCDQDDFLHAVPQIPDAAGAFELAAGGVVAGGRQGGVAGGLQGFELVPVLETQPLDFALHDRGGVRQVPGLADGAQAALQGNQRPADA